MLSQVITGHLRPHCLSHMRNRCVISSHVIRVTNFSSFTSRYENRINYHLSPSNGHTFQTWRLMATKPPPPPEKKGFFGQVLENIRSDMARNKEMKQNLAEFRKEAQKLEDTDALKKAREKFQSIESETSSQLDQLKKKLGETIDEVGKTEFAKKGKEVGDTISSKAAQAAEAIGKTTEKLGENKAFQKVGQGFEGIIGQPGIYRAPTKLRKRKEDSGEVKIERTVEVNEDAMGVELHKDSKWSQGWSNFRDNNQYINKVFEWKTKMDESDAPVARAARLLSEKMTDMFGGVFQTSEMSKVLTEICRIEPSFEKNQFLKDVETDIIPNVLEAMLRGDLEILQDWCHEGTFNVLANPIRQAQELKYVFDSKVLDVENVDLAFAKMMDQGPILVITFQSQQVLVVRDMKGNVMEGDPDQIVRINYVWVLCRDQEELDPKAAWRILEMAATSSNQFL